MKEAKELREYSVKELKQYIRRATGKANKTITRVRNQKRRSAKGQRTEKAYGILRAQGYTGKNDLLIYGFKGKNKSGLLLQAQELKYFNEWGGNKTPQEKRTEYEKSYETFKENNIEFSDVSFEEYRQLVEFFGTMDDLIENFGYTEIKSLIDEQNESGSKYGKPSNLIKAMKNVLKENKGITDKDGKTSQEVSMDLLREYIQKND